FTSRSIGMSRIEHWPSCSSFSSLCGVLLPCFTAPVCLATDFCSGRPTRFKTDKLAAPNSMSHHESQSLYSTGYSRGFSRDGHHRAGERRTRGGVTSWTGDIVGVLGLGRIQPSGGEDASRLAWCATLSRQDRKST